MKKFTQKVQTTFISFHLLWTPFADAAYTSTVSNGSAAVGETVDGKQVVEAGGLAVNTQIVSGGSQDVYGVTSSSALATGTQQTVFNGGEADATQLTSARQTIAAGGMANSSVLNGQSLQQVSGTANGTTINRGSTQQVLSGGIANSSIINDGGLTTVAQGGEINFATVNDGASLQVAGTANSTTLNGVSRLTVLSSGEANSTTLNNASVMQIYGIANTLTANAGSRVLVAQGGELNFGTINAGAQLDIFGSANNTLVDIGGQAIVERGAKANTVTLQDTGTMTVYGEANYTQLNDGGVLVVASNGLANMTTVENGGLLQVYGSATGTTLNSGGTLTIENGGQISQKAADTMAGQLNILRGGMLLMGGGSSASSVSNAGSILIGNGTRTASFGTLVLNGGSVGVDPSTTPFTLNITTLSGNGDFNINTNLAAVSGDLINVTGSATGSYVLHVLNKGRDPLVAADYRIVHVASGDATFSVDGNAVDVGTWQYRLLARGGDWYLTPTRTVTPSTSSVISLANVTPVLWYSDMDLSAARLQELTQQEPGEGNVWLKTSHSRSRIDAENGAGYSLNDSRMALGGDKQWQTPIGSLTLGGFGTLGHAKLTLINNGRGDVDSRGLGAYASWISQQRYYVSGLVQRNAYQTDNQPRMTDGLLTHGSYDNHGVGWQLEGGRRFISGSGWFAQPFVRYSEFTASAVSYTLDNDMLAEVGKVKSRRVGGGLMAGKTLTFNHDVQLQPYVQLALQRELDDGGTTQVNGNPFSSHLKGNQQQYRAGLALSQNQQMTMNLDIGLNHGTNIRQQPQFNAGMSWRF